MLCEKLKIQKSQITPITKSGLLLLWLWLNTVCISIIPYSELVRKSNSFIRLFVFCIIVHPPKSKKPLGYPYIKPSGLIILFDQFK
jgi:hypothetical protein